MSERTHTVFVLRISRDEGRRLTGIVERVSTGQKVRVQHLEDLCAVISQMVETTLDDV